MPDDCRVSQPVIIVLFLHGSRRGGLGGEDLIPREDSHDESQDDAQK
jgi:hypothetical protein